MSLKTDIVEYEASLKSKWNEFVDKSRNQSLLFYRDYMDYHKDRFSDSSLLFYKGDTLIALLPAHRIGSRIFSHNGLTYGGFIVGNDMTAELMLAISSNLKFRMSSEGLDSLFYKAMPYIYHKLPSQEDLYALFRIGARLVRRDVGTVIPLTFGYEDFRSRMRKRRIIAANSNDIVIKESTDYRTFMQIVSGVLRNRYKTTPVHTWEEIYYLASKFPTSIKLYSAFLGDTMISGVLLYESSEVVHAQYGFTSEKGRELCSLDLVYDHILKQYFNKKSYFSFGISTEQNGTVLNENLIKYKESFGGFSVVSDFYQLDLK